MNRIHALDLARGFTVLCIPAIHTGMLYSKPSVHGTVLGQCLIAVAEGPGGQLLMLLMGFSFTLKSRHTTHSVLIKSAALLAAGYGLNVLKFVVPYNLGLLPAEVLGELAVGERQTVWQLATIGDILHFAALALPVLHILYRRKGYQYWALAAAVAVSISSPWVWDRHAQAPVLQYLLSLAGGQPPRVFFPLFPWLAYPLAGLCIGHYWRTHAHETAWGVVVVGVLLCAGGTFATRYFPSESPAGFYRTHFAGTCWHLGVVVLVLALWDFSSRYLRTGPFSRLLVYSSRHITMLYLIQWVLVCWLLQVIGFRKLGAAASAAAMMAMTVATYLLNYLFQKIIRYR